MIRAAELAPSRAGRRRITQAPRQARRNPGTHTNTPLCTHTHLNTPLCTHRHTHIGSRTVHACTLQRHAQRSPVCTHAQICANVPKVCAHSCSHHTDWCTIALCISQCVHTHPGHTPLQTFLPTRTPTPVHAQPMHTHVLAPVHPPSTCCACTPMHVILLPTHSPLSRCAPLGTPSCPQRHPDPAPHPVAGAQHAPETSQAGGMKTFITDISFRVAN